MACNLHISSYTTTACSSPDFSCSIRKIVVTENLSPRVDRSQVQSCVHAHTDFDSDSDSDKQHYTATEKYKAEFLVQHDILIKVRFQLCESGSILAVKQNVSSLTTTLANDMLCL